ncbi:helix-turn-helix domain-containing protein [Streptomyces sp. NPDC048045]|uniref:AraC family transcriptional regulator n=1 Tax=Streptomyces sp. NPDC048045 TaxID=3154710 RepID=UPI0034353E3C
MSTTTGAIGRRPVLTRVPPAPGLRNTVQSYAGYEYGHGSPQRRMVCPDTLATITFGFGGATVRTASMVGTSQAVSARSMAILPVLTAMLGWHDGGVCGVVLRLTPMGAYRLFGVPMREWDLPHMDPVHLLPRDLRHLPQQLEEVDWPERFRTLNRVLPPLLERGPSVAAEVTWAWRELHRAHGRLHVTELAAATHWSSRHLERRFQEQIGRSPAAIARILRFKRALRLQASGLPLSKVAQLAGFHDQAHYNHVCKAMTGLTPRQIPGNPDDRSPVDHLLADPRPWAGDPTWARDGATS